MRKLLLLCPQAIEMMEFSVFVDVFGWARSMADGDVEVVTCGYHETVVSTFGIPIQMDMLVKDVNPEEFAALAIPGGFRECGFGKEAYCEDTQELIRAFYNAGKPIATVCVAAFALAESGILKGRRATTYHLDDVTQGKLAEYGVNVVNQPVVVDDTIITSYCPETAVHVAYALLSMLSGEECMKAVKHAMGYE